MESAALNMQYAICRLPAGSHSLLQGIFPTQEWKPGLPHCRWILYQLSHRKPKDTGVGSLFLLQWLFPTQKSNQGLLHSRWILYQLIYMYLIPIYEYIGMEQTFDYSITL